MISSPGQEDSITRVSKTPLFIRLTVVVVVVAESVAPAALVRFIQTPPRVSRPDCIDPPVRPKAIGLRLLSVVPAPGSEKSRNSPGVSKTSACM